jgi:hypothetical protein
MCKCRLGHIFIRRRKLKAHLNEDNETRNRRSWVREGDVLTLSEAHTAAGSFSPHGPHQVPDQADLTRQSAHRVCYAMFTHILTACRSMELCNRDEYLCSRTHCTSNNEGQGQTIALHLCGGGHRLPAYGLTPARCELC